MMYLSPPNADDPSPRPLRLIEPHRIARAARDDETRRAIEARLGTARHVVIRPSLFDRTCDWLSDTFSGPRGFVWFAGTVVPLAVGAFCLGYFGLRELLAGLGL